MTSLWTVNARDITPTESVISELNLNVRHIDNYLSTKFIFICFRKKSTAFWFIQLPIFRCLFRCLRKYKNLILKIIFDWKLLTVARNIWICSNFFVFPQLIGNFYLRTRISLKCLYLHFLGYLSKNQCFLSCELQYASLSDANV